uniref:Uncharacterized protein n=1 Tax=Phenylobacterium glaciei TaxID=2803784 RepID=A0A974S7S1_9CAUL|nr:hypothetical protein JKL49_16580 [Phenylobacterium glaciei]
MVRSGSAWAYRAYLTDLSFIKLEDEARRARRALVASRRRNDCALGLEAPEERRPRKSSIFPVWRLQVWRTCLRVKALLQGNELLLGGALLPASVRDRFPGRG